MKKFYTMLLAALSLCAVSCQEGPIETQSPTPPSQGETMTFTASLAPETRTSLNGDNTMWNPNDQITIFDENGAHEVFTSQNTEPSPTATFKGKALSGNEFFAVYGNVINENLTFKGAKTVILNIPNTQYVSVDGGFDENAVPLLAYSTSNELYFKNVATLLTFTVGDDNVNHVKFETDQLISGNALVAMGDKNEISINEQPMNPAYEYVDIYAGSEAKKEVFKKGVNYCVAIFPKTVSTFDWKVARSNETDPVAVKTYFNPNPITFVSSAKVNMGELKHTKIYLKGSHNSWQEKDEFIETGKDYYIIKEVELSTNDTFKVYATGWGDDTWLGYNGNIISSYGDENWIQIYSNGGKDMKLQDSGTYNIRFNPSSHYLGFYKIR